jgi:hypothetical protein
MPSSGVYGTEDGIVCRNILSQLKVFSFFVIFNLVFPKQFFNIMYQLELTPKSYELVRLNIFPNINLFYVIIISK